MASRTTTVLIAGIIKVKATISLTPFMDAANMMVTRCCTELDTDYSAGQLVVIETWLAAHFYSVRDMRPEQERADVVSRKFQSKVDLGFDTSHYGQMAMRLDYYGGLASLNEQIKSGVKKAVGITWLGTENPDLTLDDA